MARKVLSSYQLLTAQSTGASFNSDAINCLFYDRICFFLSWGTTAVGSIIAQGSINGTDFVDLDMNAIVLNNAADTALIDIYVTGIPYVRLAYTRSSGTGTIDGYISMKEAS